jgi:hypothetical protein
MLEIRASYNARPNLYKVCTHMYIPGATMWCLSRIGLPSY